MSVLLVSTRPQRICPLRSEGFSARRDNSPCNPYATPRCAARDGKPGNGLIGG
jgi:hypothetical protein